MQSPQFKVVIVITVKNEAAYLLEWIAYHRAIGADHFLIYNNDSTDETPQILQCLDKSGIITYVEWPSQPNCNNQLEAYRDACKRLDGKCEWVAFIDCDEFIVPTQDSDLPSFLSKYEDVAGLAVNWKLFGSSGHLSKTEGLVMERFTRCASSDFHMHQRFKTIARLKFLKDVGIHMCEFEPGETYCYADRVLTPKKRLGRGEHITYDLIQINHYFNKSRAEWDLKRARGRATQDVDGLSKIRKEQGFNLHDRNEEKNLSILDFLETTKKEIKGLKNILNLHSIQTFISTPKDTIKISQWLPLIKYNKKLLVGSHIGLPKVGAEVESTSVKISGWVLGRDATATTVEIICNGRILSEASVDKARPDVAKAHPTSPHAQNSGFSTSVSLMGMPSQSVILVQGILENESRVPLYLIKYHSSENSLTVNEIEPEKYQLAKTPLLTPKANKFLKDFLSKNIDARVLEFGSGASTVWLSKRTGNLVSIEHDRDWYDNVKNSIEQHESCSSVDLKILPTPYYSVCNEFPDEHFDVIIVDGRDRIKCLESSIRILKKGGFLILDDAQRARYEKAAWLLQDWEFTRSISPTRQTHWWQKPLKFEALASDWSKVLEQNSIRLYAGDLTGRARKDAWVGVSNRKSDENHIQHDLTKPFPIPDAVVNAFLSEDVFQLIQPYKLLTATFPELYRILKPGGFIRMALPDYRCDLLQDGVGKDDRSQSGSANSNIAHRGHVWFPTYETLKGLIELSPLRDCQVHWLHYYDTNGEPVMNEIDYSKGFVKRTPDNDPRVQNPRRPMSIVVDLYKVSI